jgi:hypothetical protein
MAGGCREQLAAKNIVIFTGFTVATLTAVIV